MIQPFIFVKVLRTNNINIRFNMLLIRFIRIFRAVNIRLHNNVIMLFLEAIHILIYLCLDEPVYNTG